MSSASVIFMLSGALCLVLSGLVMYKFMPRQGKTTPSWTRTELGDSTVALGTFVLLISGLALLAKGFLL